MGGPVGALTVPSPDEAPAGVPYGVAAPLEQDAFGKMPRVAPLFPEKAFEVRRFVVAGFRGHAAHHHARRIVRGEKRRGGVGREHHIVQPFHARRGAYVQAQLPVRIPQRFPLAPRPGPVHVAYMAGHMRIDDALHVVVRGRRQRNPARQGHFR